MQTSPSKRTGGNLILPGFSTCFVFANVTHTKLKVQATSNRTYFIDTYVRKPLTSNKTMAARDGVQSSDWKLSKQICEYKELLFCENSDHGGQYYASGTSMDQTLQRVGTTSVCFGKENTCLLPKLKNHTFPLSMKNRQLDG